MRKLLFVTFYVTCLWVAGAAQSFKVSGKVTDAGGNPLAGASIREKGTKNGTVADNTGSFSL